MSRDDSSISARLKAVEDRIEAAVKRCGRRREDVRLVAVSKKFSAGAIREAYQAGLREFGENYVQEFAQKQPELADLRDARFHLIGHLQSNKAREASSLFQVIHTVDSAKLLQRLETFAAASERQIDVLIEVKLSEEPSKTGVKPESIPELLDAAQRCPHLCLKGLMTMPPWSENPERSRPYFQRLAQLGRQCGLRDFSMGMSGDFEVAIEEGATIIRVGTAIFGPRARV